MIKKTMSYVDFNGNERKEDVYFALTEAELYELELSQNGGLENYLTKISQSQDTKEIWDLFSSIVLKAYGEKSLDGKFFQKKRDGHKLSEDFEQTQMFSDMIVEFMQDASSFAVFLKGVLPKKISDQISDKDLQIALNGPTAE